MTEESMTPRLLKGSQAEYVTSDYPGHNPSGLQPFGKHVLIRMDVASAKTMGGIHLADDMVDRMTLAAETGSIFAVGPEAFMYHDNGKPWDGPKPALGDRVYVLKYSGVVARGADGHVYRVMDYSCICAGIDPAAQYLVEPGRVGEQQ